VADFLQKHLVYRSVFDSQGGKMETKINAPKILIVDDEIGPRESLRMILKPNYNVFTVENGYAAIQMVNRLSLILLRST